MIEERLAVSGPVQGYLYAGTPGQKDKVLYKCYACKRWLWQARVVLTQDNAGGGALILRLHLPTGVSATLASGFLQGTASAGNVLTAYLLDEDGSNAGALAINAAGATKENSFPAIGAAATALNTRNTTGMLIGPGQYLYFSSATALQTETMTVYLALIIDSKTAPTWDTTGSAGTPNLAASTISEANTWQELIC